MNLQTSADLRNPKYQTQAPLFFLNGAGSGVIPVIPKSDRLPGTERMWVAIDPALHRKRGVNNQFAIGSSQSDSSRRKVF